jgi:hypothetical protein
MAIMCGLPAPRSLRSCGSCRRSRPHGRLAALNVIVDGGAKVIVRIRGSSNTGSACMLVDDALLQRIR